MLAQPTWQGIPVEVKKDIVELLDYKSRFCLRVCSKHDKALVDNSPFHISRILFHVVKSPAIPFAYCFLLVTNQGKEVEVSTNAVEHFVNIFLQKRSFVEGVKIVCADSNDADSPLIRLIDLTGSMGPDFKIRTRHVDLFIRGMDKQYNLEVLQLFDPNLLESITLSKSISRGTLRKMSEFDVWKNAKQLYSRYVQNISVDWILHMEKITVHFEKISEGNVEKLIKRFITHEGIKRGFGFQLRHGNTLNLRKIPCLNVHERNENDRWTRRSNFFTQPFPTTNKDLVFFVKFSCQTITGTACYASDYIHDYFSCRVRHPSHLIGIYECEQRIQSVREQEFIDNHGDYFQYGPYLTSPVNINKTGDALSEHSESASQRIQFNPDASLYISSFPSVI